MESNERGPHGCGAWASAWGEDRFGVWADLRVETAATGGTSATRLANVVQRMRWIPAGEFWMGSEVEDPNVPADEKPRHLVRVTRGFWLGDTPVTQAFFAAVMGVNPSRFRDGPDAAGRPVENVDWITTHQFHARLERMWQAENGATEVLRSGGELGEGDGRCFRLPTEAEWEFACGSDAEAAGVERLDGVAWYAANSGKHTEVVGRKVANPRGLYDLLGNVWEWCADAGEHSQAYAVGMVEDPVCCEGPWRLVRGGSWRSGAHHVRPTVRRWNAPGNCSGNLGFRLARAHPLPFAPVAGEKA